MRVIVGLGNPGASYKGTRHNIGYAVVDYMATAPAFGPFRPQFHGVVAEGINNNDKLLVLKPETFMNLSGRSVRALLDFYKLPVEHLLIVCDDFNLPLGKLRVRKDGSHGGQKGLQLSILKPGVYPMNLALFQVRIGYIRDQASVRFARDAKRLDSMKGLRILDIGCGGGILSEPLARLGADMVGVDPSDTNIAAAAEHAAQSELAIDYRCTTAEELAEAGEEFDIVLAMEVVEHVADVPLFVQSCATMVKPGGMMIGA